MTSVVRELASFTAAMDAPGATPLLPAAMAATAVPWPDWSAEETSPAAISAPENTAPWRKPSGGVPSAVMSQRAATRLLPSSRWNSGWVRSSPESTNPMSTPSPVSPSPVSRWTGGTQAASMLRSTKQLSRLAGSKQVTWRCASSPSADCSPSSMMANCASSSSVG